MVALFCPKNFLKTFTYDAPFLKLDSIVEVERVIFRLFQEDFTSIHFCMKGKGEFDIEEANNHGKGSGKLSGCAYGHDLYYGETESDSASKNAQPHPVYKRID